MSDPGRVPAEGRPIGHESCVICLNILDARTELIHLPCGHYACHGCRGDAIRHSLRPGGQFPPECCGKPFREHQYSDLVTEPQLQQAKERLMEREAKDAVFCHNKDCGSFIRDRLIGDGPDVLAWCYKCLFFSCSGCSRFPHPGSKCQPPSWEQDTKMKKYIKTANLKQCPGCKFAYKREQGCRHMSEYRL